MSEWNKTQDVLPSEGLLVMTKLDDERGVRNEQQLMRIGRLWWFKDRSMYVYYIPTHWKEITQ